jgi:hypothetical protein
LPKAWAVCLVEQPGLLHVLALIGCRTIEQESAGGRDRQHRSAEAIEPPLV